MKNRKELALIYLANARMYFDKIFNLLDREEEYNEIEDYYGTIDAKLTDLKHEIEWLEEFKQLSLDVEFEGENPTDKEIDKFLEKLERGDKC